MTRIDPDKVTWDRKLGPALRVGITFRNLRGTMTRRAKTRPVSLPKSKFSEKPD